MRLESVFPIPVAFDNFYRPLSSNEIEFAKNVALRKNVTNQSSTETYVLKSPLFQELGAWIDTRAKDFFNHIYQPSGEVELYITQSWINHSGVGEAHHVHAHPNSIVSGVFYIDADPDVDKITFVKTNTKDIDLIPKEYNGFNSNTWYYTVSIGQLVLFPSNLKHTVETVEPSPNRKTRISLSFNTFIRGHINPGIDLAELFL
jgi:uncharacterized protein (TIGR02466 family)